MDFSLLDYYVLFVIIFVFNFLGGLYFTFYDRQSVAKKDYLFGGNTMKPFPIALSLIASHISANLLLSVPGDVYRYGAEYLLGAISNLIITIITVRWYLPVFYKLKITSVFEYLEIRFDYKTRIFASFMSIFSSIFFLPIAIYVPALAFSAVSGANVHLMAAGVSFICIFYTTVGGLKAVVWTDAFQFMISLLTLTIITIIGIKATGGLEKIWNSALDSQRLDIFDFDLDPTKRQTFWSVVIGLTFLRLSMISISPSCVQKFLSVPTLRQANLSLFYFSVGHTLVKTLTVFLGLLLYAKYSSCDPVLSHQVKTDEQLLPYFVMQVSQNIPGLPGLFIAGITSASMSALSSELNCLAGLIYEDFICKIFPKKFNSINATFILKNTVMCLGIVTLLLVLVVERLGGLFPLSMSIAGVTTGSTLGMFTLGIFFPSATAKGARYGGIVGVITMSCIIFPAQYYKAQKKIIVPAKMVSIEGCNLLNLTSFMNESLSVVNEDLSPPSSIFSISFYYYATIGTVVTVAVGLLISSLSNMYSASPRYTKLVNNK